MFNSSQKSFGVVKIDKTNVKVYESQTRYSTISVCKEVTDARWVGDSVVVYLKDGGVRRYTSQSQYINV